jgi:hypothetical protein
MRARPEHATGRTAQQGARWYVGDDRLLSADLHAAYAGSRRRSGEPRPFECLALQLACRAGA